MKALCTKINLFKLVTLIFVSSGTNTELLVLFSGTSVVFETLEVLMLVVPAVVRSKPAPSSVPVGSFQADGCLLQLDHQ